MTLIFSVRLVVFKVAASQANRRDSPLNTLQDGKARRRFSQKGVESRQSLFQHKALNMAGITSYVIH